MLNMITKLCTDRKLHFNPSIVHVDFEIAMHNAIRRVLPQTRIDCCRFHLGQAWWRKIQKLGLSAEYKDKTCDIGKWLTQFFGLAFLEPDEVDDCFAMELMAQTPDDQRCSDFADYVVVSYVQPEALFPPSLWADPPTLEARRTTNGPEAFHRHYNEQFYTAHLSIFVFLDVILQLQTTLGYKFSAPTDI